MNNHMQVATPVIRRGLDNLIRVQLIRKYQRVEGNYDCCASAYVRVCQQAECLWRNECRKLVQD